METTFPVSSLVPKGATVLNDVTAAGVIFQNTYAFLYTWSDYPLNISLTFS